MPDKSEISELPTIEGIFDSLDRWRHLPAYQLERLAGVFFALFLPEVLEKVLKVKIKRPLIPEFPIRTNSKDNLSRKIDYFALSEDHKYAFLIELKTDMESIDGPQISFLENTLKYKNSRGGTRCLIEDVIHLTKLTKLTKNENNPKPTRKKSTRNKYVHLLSHLRQLNLICYDEKKLYERAFANNSRGVYEALESVGPSKWIFDDKPKLKVIYIQPKPNGDSPTPILSDCDWHRMYFDCFEDHVKERGPIGHRFAESLRRWKEPAGSCPPKP